MTANYFPFGVLLLFVGIAVLGCLVWRQHRSQLFAQRERDKIARELAELREAVREHLGDRQAQKIISTAVAPQPDQPVHRRRHLELVPPVATWTEKHPGTTSAAALTVIGVAVTLLMAGPSQDGILPMALPPSHSSVLAPRGTLSGPTAPPDAPGSAPESPAVPPPASSNRRPSGTAGEQPAGHTVPGVPVPDHKFSSFPDNSDTVAVSGPAQQQAPPAEQPGPRPSDPPVKASPPPAGPDRSCAIALDLAPLIHACYWNDLDRRRVEPACTLASRVQHHSHNGLDHRPLHVRAQRLERTLNIVSPHD